MNIHFKLKESKKETRLIMMRVNDRGFEDNYYRGTTKIHVKPKDWDAKKKRPRPGTICHDDILMLEGRIGEFFRLNKNKKFTKQDFQIYVFGENDEVEDVVPDLAITTSEDVKQKPLLELFDEFHKENPDIEPNTQKSYDTPVEKLREFLSLPSVGKTNITIDNFDHKLEKRFEKYLGEHHLESTKFKYLKVLKSFLKYSTLVGKIKLGFDYTLIKIKYPKPGLNNALDMDHLELLFNTSFEGKTLLRKTKRGLINLDHVKWLFLLNCFTGFRIGDSKRVVKNIKGNLISIVTQKQNILVEQEITKMVGYILNLFKYNPPYMSDADFNWGIKHIYKALWPDEPVEKEVPGSSKPITVPRWQELRTHDAVKTYVTMLINLGVPIPDVAHIVGKNIATIQRTYYRHDADAARKRVKAALDGPTPIAKKRMDSLFFKLTRVVPLTALDLAA